MPVHSVAAKGFHRAARAYERARPGYPPEALRFLFREFRIGPGKVVVDVAAGTGKLTRALLPSGATVVAVEPVPGMRSEFRRAVPGVRLLRGTAERLPLPDDSVDLITVGQAFHWFDAPRALREFARVLRPGGGVALLWNTREERERWVRKVWGEAGNYPRHVPEHRVRKPAETFRRSGRFTRLLRREFPGVRAVQTPREVLDRIASVSWVAALPAKEREGLLARAAEAMRTHPDTRGKRELVIPYKTEVWWSRRRPSPTGSRAAGGISVRDARPSDRRALDRWHAGLYSEIHRTDRRYYAPIGLARAHTDVGESLRLLRRSPAGFVLVAELGGRPCGFASVEVAEMPHRHHRWTRRPNLEGRVATLFVDPRARRRGVATALLREAQERLLALGCDNVQLGVVASNRAARALYQKVGFREFGLRLRKDLARPPRSWGEVAARHARIRRRPRPSPARRPAKRSKGR